MQAGSLFYSKKLLTILATLLFTYLKLILHIEKGSYPHHHLLQDYKNGMTKLLKNQVPSKRKKKDTQAGWKKICKSTAINRQLFTTAFYAYQLSDSTGNLLSFCWVIARQGYNLRSLSQCECQNGNYHSFIKHMTLKEDRQNSVSVQTDSTRTLNFQEHSIFKGYGQNQNQSACSYTDLLSWQDVPFPISNEEITCHYIKHIFL